MPGWAQDETIITSHGYSTFGDLKYPADFTHLAYVNPDAPKGGEISTWAQGTFDTFNPYSREGRAGSLATIGYESLMTGTADEVSGNYCLLCTTLEYPESEDWVIFHMRPEAKFSDGTPLTAHDVVFSYNLLLEQGLPSYAEAVKELIQTVEAIDDYTVKFTFMPDIPRRNLISQAGSTPVWSKAWYERTGARLDETQLEISPGSGPYMLDSYDLNRQIVYKRNPDYWGEDLPINIGQNNFDTIRVEYFADTTVALEGFKAGEFTFRQENSSINWATAYDFPALDNGWVVKAELPNGNLPGANGILFNLRREAFQDVRVRQALALMYNFTWTNDFLQFSLFDQRESFWQNSDMQAQGVPEGRERELLQSASPTAGLAVDPDARRDELRPDRRRTALEGGGDDAAGRAGCRPVGHDPPDDPARGDAPRRLRRGHRRRARRDSAGTGSACQRLTCSARTSNAGSPPLRRRSGCPRSARPSSATARRCGSRRSGMADVEAKRDATPETQYRIGSITKTFTAVGIMQLRDAGELSLDDPLTAYLPESAHGPTIGRMLAHSSGLQREPPGEIWETMKAPSREELLTGTGDAEQVLDPGTWWHYSNLAFALLGEVVARAHGGTWEDALRERILEPLGLGRTTPDETEPAARGYFVEPYSDAVRLEPELDLGGAGALGKLWSTTGDLARWGSFLVSGDDRVLSAGTLEQMSHVRAMVDHAGWTRCLGNGARALPPRREPLRRPRRGHARAPRGRSSSTGRRRSVRPC